MSVYTEETYSKGENSHKIYQTRNSCFKRSWDIIILDVIETKASQ